MHAGRAALAAAAAVTALLVLLAPPAAPAAPLQLTVTVVPPSGAPGPRPTGGVTVSVDGRRLLSVPLVRGVAPLTSITPQLSAALDVLGHRVTISYSGDSNYEASTGISVTVPTRRLLTIAARPRDTAAPAIEIVAPRDGARYAVGEAVVAAYSCRDPGDRSAVTACDGPVASGSAVDTASAGRFSFVVTSVDALGNAASKTVTY
ncbi:MAG: serralysin, partial [Solirubrobacteraceae bacterium]|nr:serralysin [Solirubrobacteraceae bacterium]